MKSEKVVYYSSRLLGTTVWISSILFGLYILSFYFLALLKGDTAQWNEVLPGLYDNQISGATIGIGIHFTAGGVILILGCIQLLDRVRIKFPAIHHWLGRLYVFASIITALGGLTFILIKGTIGGIIMDIGFAGYGILTFLCAIQTIKYAMQKRFELHRGWAIRLFALAIGSWLYRMDYGFWFLFTDGLWHTRTFSGPFDYFMDFFFYLPNLLLAEVFIRRKDLLGSDIGNWLITIGLIITTAFLVLATYYFTKHLWGPAILDLVGI